MELVPSKGAILVGHWVSPGHLTMGAPEWPYGWRRVLRTILHLINLSQRYHWSKGSPECQVEDPPQCNLAATGYLEESASHHS